MLPLERLQAVFAEYRIVDADSGEELLRIPDAHHALWDLSIAPGHDLVEAELDALDTEIRNAISWEQFKELYLVLMPHANDPQKAAKQFRALNADGKGYITRDEAPDVFGASSGRAWAALSGGDDAVTTVSAMDFVLTVVAGVDRNEAETHVRNYFPDCDAALAVRPKRKRSRKALVAAAPAEEPDVVSVETRSKPATPPPATPDAAPADRTPPAAAPAAEPTPALAAAAASPERSASRQRADPAAETGGSSQPAEQREAAAPNAEDSGQEKAAAPPPKEEEKKKEGCCIVA